MMATEVTQSNPADAVITSTEPTITISPDPENVDQKQSLLNGAATPASEEIENKQLSDIVDDLVNSAEVSISGGSDNEAAKGDSKDGAKGHTRTSSAVKKPTSFKSVSVNKTFLGNKASGASTPNKSPEKQTLSAVSSSGQASSAVSAVRPRLVAKSGNVSRDGLKASGSAGGKAGAPDPSVVWNKNRPPPVVEPKKLTDEELKKYGIHMTARLAPEDSRGGAGNWADVDDDDDDWIPSEIQWNDGTKVTIPAVEETPSPAPAPAVPVQPPAPAATTEVKSIEKPKSPAPTGSSLSGKPGVAVLGLGKGLAYKGVPEKPVLVQKTASQTGPVKSPWAALPPVEKTSPVAMDILNNQAPGRMQPRDSHPLKSMTPPPAKEIAADDFSRSNGPVNPNRELFNSHSGRYEPVTDRRAGGRSEPYRGQPPAALLQRPSHTDGPPGPSPAFQSSRADQEPPYGRRRGSSNVSGGSGTFFQRLPKPHDHGVPPMDHLNPRRGSLASDSPVSPSGARHPGQGSPWQARASPYTPHAVPHLNEQREVMPMPPQGPTEDDYELQKKVMAEKLKAARQRKAEEEAKAEAERKERIAAKLAAMGPAPESRSAKNAAKEAPPDTPTAATPTVAHASTDNSQSQALDGKASLASKSTEGAGPTDQAVNGGARTMASISRSAQPVTGGESRPTTSQDRKPQQPWQGSTSSQQPEKMTQSERFSWASAQSSARNVWAAPNNNRSLGNGTFNSDLGRVTEGYPPTIDQMPANSATGPGPIGPPTGGKAQSGHQPRPIAPPASVAAGKTRSANLPEDDPRTRWANATMAGDDKVKAENRERLAQQKAEQEARGQTEDARPTFHDSWKPVKLDNTGRRVETKSRVEVVHAGTWKPSTTAEPDSAATVPTGPASTTASAQPSVGPSPKTRASRFFPARTEGVLSQESNRYGSPSPPPPDMDGHPAFDGDATHPHVALPPTRPVVRLPPSAAQQPKDATSSSTGPAQTFGWANPKSYKESLRSPPSSQPRGPSGHPATSTWQSRINDLLHDKPNPQQTRTAVDSTTRRAMESTTALHQVTVSLPGSSTLGTTEGNSPTSKTMAEECFEEQEMGSLPPVHLPSKTPDAAWNPASEPPRLLPKKFFIIAVTVEAFEETPQNSLCVFIPGATSKKRFDLPASSRSYSNNSQRHGAGNNGRGGRSGGPRSHIGSSRGGGNGARPRDQQSAAYQQEGNSSQQPSTSGGGNRAASHTGRGRGPMRRSADWARGPSTPVQT